MNAINSWIKRNPLWTILLCVAIVLPLFGFISVQTNSFNNPEDLFTRELNPDNLLKTGEDGNVTLTTHTTESGMAVTVSDNGAVKVKGGNSSYSGSSEKLQYAEIKLPAGTYTISSGLDHPSTATEYVTVTYGDKSATADLGQENPGTFTLTEETTVVVWLHLCPAEDHNVTFYPVLVADDEAGSFYA